MPDDRGKGGTEHSAGSQAGHDDDETDQGEARHSTWEPPKYSLNQWASYWWNVTKEDPREKFDARVYVDDFNYMTELEAARVVHDVQDARAFMAECYEHWIQLDMTMNQICTGHGSDRVNFPIKEKLILLIPDYPDRLRLLQHFEVPVTGWAMRHAVTVGPGRQAFLRMARQVYLNTAADRIRATRQEIYEVMQDARWTERRKISDMQGKYFGQDLRPHDGRRPVRVQDIVRDYDGYRMIGPIWG